MQAILQNPFLKYLYGFLPKPKTIILAMVCFAIGMVFAYGTVSWINGDPSRLDQSWQDQWVRGIEARYRNPNAAADNNPQDVLNLLSAVDAPLEIVERLNIGDASFRSIAEQANAQAPRTPRDGGIISNIIIPVVWVVVFGIVYAIAFFLWAFIVWPFLKRYLVKRDSTVDDATAKAEINKIKQAKAIEKEMATQAVDSTRFGTHIIRKPSIYQAGFGNYDDSFNIETDEGTYYGEAGASIAEKIGDGGVTAIEIWMFDKDEFANTPTAIFASEYAFNDPALKSRLEPRGDVIMAVPGAKAILETAALYVEARVMTIEYDPAAPMPNSVITNMTTEVIAWAKSAGGTGVSAPPAPMPVMDTAPSPATFAPPPAPGGAPMPSNPPAPDPFAPPPPMGGSGQTPLAPPPLGGSPKPPYDPFGGTGDFTPVSRDD